MALLVALAVPFSAAAAPELTMVSEHPVEGIAAGNLSGLAWCGDALWAVSDREDNVLYRLDASDTVWRAEAERFELPPCRIPGCRGAYVCAPPSLACCAVERWISKA